jgi:hypothetical protein
MNSKKAHKVARSPFRNVLIIKRSEIIAADTVLPTIEARCAQVGMSISTLCREAGVTRTAYYHWKRGGGMMPETLQAIENAIKKAERDVERSRSDEVEASLGGAR